MKTILISLFALACIGCEIYTPTGAVTVGPYIEVSETCIYDDTPYYYEEVWTCWDGCCTWIIDYPYYYTTCEETWCIYETQAGLATYCSWELVDEYCY